ncbi:MAG: ligase-associated DNA damage response exonuclease [Wenzhouxiangellaceae bacterium]
MLVDAGFTSDGDNTAMVSAHDSLLVRTQSGLYCPRGDFYIDPQRPVARAVITHGHADHVRPGCGHYYATPETLALTTQRYGELAAQTPMHYGELLALGCCEISLHAAGHILGSAQVRLSDGNQVWVISGDYKRDRDPTCEAFEIVPCDVLITEATFAWPIYRWPDAAHRVSQLLGWWRQQQHNNAALVVFCYALGKAQRILAELADHLDRPVYLHGATAKMVEQYRELGVSLPPTETITGQPQRGQRYAGDLILAPPSAAGSPWMKRFPGAATVFASGWMTVRGQRRRRGYDHGLVLSDHADWPALLKTIQQSAAKKIYVTHGNEDSLVRYLRERGRDAHALNVLAAA